MARWYADLVSARGILTWSGFQEFEKLKYQPGQQLDVFFDKFQALNKQAQIKDQEFVKRFLVKALPEELANHAKFYLNGADPALTTVEMLIAQVKSVFDAFFKTKWTKSRVAASKKQKFFNNENNAIIKVRTNFFLDTGSSFSCISPKLAQILEVKVNSNNKGFIKTCKKDNVIDRIGYTEEELTVTYSSRQCSAEFEIVDIFNDIDVVIGMDLIMKIGITISNMAMDWDDNNNPEIPPIDPNPYVPNESPYGTPAEREHFLKEIEPYIGANKNIDPKPYCNIPGSTLTLHVLKDHEHKMYRPQWPLEEKFLPAIKEQMAKWIKNGVIEPAPPGFCLSGKELTLDSRKVGNVLDWAPKVANSKELKSRLGLMNYFSSHLPCLSTLTAPLDAIKNAPDINKVWTKEHTNAMTNIQQLLASSPVLSAPNLAHPFCLVTDSSAYGIGACLYQVINNRIYYNSFIARKLSPSERRYGSSKRELLAVVYAFTKFRQWLWGNKFHLFLDNRGLLYISLAREAFPGMDNILADRHSRMSVPDTKKLEGEWYAS
ncbi:hypothetical protein [Parasitella parasitica]|uniref:Reverse transcriptase/retrotransposon-derived protein RNase H-like domain-containing protein n=2 Tax=Parasitella parasitica TaxID=35722 RepID=A0A0B7NJ00_9FUNG|nr:hypothetical protein [Parasitella parasitica]